MTKRINWVKGMRLTDEVFRLSDQYNAEYAGMGLVLGLDGRFGLIPSERQFQISLDFRKNQVSVISLDCLAVTAGGHLVDVAFDSRYSSYQDVQTAFSMGDEDKAYFFLVSVTGKWVDAGDGTCLPVYGFHIVEEHSRIPDNAIPVARVVCDMGWRQDEVSFVPPCVLLSAHPKYMDCLSRFKELLAKLDLLVPQRLVTVSGDARRLFWPALRDISIEAGTMADQLNPASLLQLIQKCVSRFWCACSLDDSLQLSDESDFQEYVSRPFSFRDTFAMINEGLSLVERICTKMENISKPEPARLPAPYISDGDLRQLASTNTLNVKVQGIAAGSTVLYSLDGSEPSLPLKDGRICLNLGFKPMGKEPDKKYTVKLKASANGVESETSTFEMVVVKNLRNWNVPLV